MSEHVFEGRSDAARPRIMVVAGEVSGDEHAAQLVAALKQLEPQSEVFGMAGAHSRHAGMETLIDSEEVGGAMGLTEVVGSIGGLVGAFRRLLKEAEARRPDVVVLIDFPEFNMLLARFLHARGIKVFYFISPQLWAWRRGRVKKMQRYVRKIAAIFPFEEEFYRLHQVDATYVGHPFLDRPAQPFDREAFLAAHGIPAECRIIGVLPGSRVSEIERLLEVMVRGFELLKREDPALHAVIPVAPALSFDSVRARLPDVEGVTLIRGEASNVLRAADASIVASGTATVEAMLAGKPYMVVYRLSALTYFVGRLLVRGVKHIAMVNVIAGKEVVPEFIQDEVTAQRIAAELKRLLGDEPYRQRLVDELGQVRDAMRYRGALGGTAAERAARIALELAAEGQ